MVRSTRWASATRALPKDATPRPIGMEREEERELPQLGGGACARVLSMRWLTRRAWSACARARVGLAHGRRERQRSQSFAGLGSLSHSGSAPLEVPPSRHTKQTSPAMAAAAPKTVCDGPVGCAVSPSRAGGGAFARLRCEMGRAPGAPWRGKPIPCPAGRGHRAPGTRPCTPCASRAGAGLVTAGPGWGCGRAGGRVRVCGLCSALARPHSRSRPPPLNLGPLPSLSPIPTDQADVRRLRGLRDRGEGRPHVPDDHQHAGR